MRIAVLSDIHGNLPALDAVLREVRQEHVEAVIVPGDLYPGPMPVEALNALLDLGLPIHWVHGNGDREALACVNGVETDWYRKSPDVWRAPVRWTAEQLPHAHRQMLAGWPPTCRVDVPGL